MRNEPKRAMLMAHIFHKDKPGFKWQDCLRHAWYFVRFRRWLTDHVVKFTYFKKDRTIRQAIGTTNLFFVPLAKRPKGDMSDGMAIERYNTITYFDLEKQEWRSFDIRNFIGYVELWPA